MLMSLNIKSAIKRAGKSSKEVAALLGISEVGLSQHINGNPSVLTLEKIANALNVDISELFDSPENNNTSITCPSCGKEINIKVE